MTFTYSASVGTIYGYTITTGTGNAGEYDDGVPCRYVRYKCLCYSGGSSTIIKSGSLYDSGGHL
jgi:hypothetical protein